MTGSSARILRRQPAVQGARLIHELDRHARLDHLGQFLRVPVGQPHAAMAFRLADLGGIGRAVDAVGRLVERDPDRADRAVRAWRNGQDLLFSPCLKLRFGL